MASLILLLMGWWVFAHGRWWPHSEVFPFLQGCFGFRTESPGCSGSTHWPSLPLSDQISNRQYGSERIKFDFSTASGDKAVELSLLGTHLDVLELRLSKDVRSKTRSKTKKNLLQMAEDCSAYVFWSDGKLLAEANLLSKSDLRIRRFILLEDPVREVNAVTAPMQL